MQLQGQVSNLQVQHLFFVQPSVAGRKFVFFNPRSGSSS